MSLGRDEGVSCLWGWAGQGVCPSGTALPAQVLASCLGGAATCLPVSLCGLGTSSQLITGVGPQGHGSWARLPSHSGGTKGHPCHPRGAHFLPGLCGDVPQDTVTRGSP